MICKSLRLLLLPPLLLVAATASAQDKIYLQDGTKVEAKIKEIGLRNIVYRRWDNPDGADYIISRHDVTRIVYQNGMEETVSASGMRGRRPYHDAVPKADRDASRDSRHTIIPGYGRNIIALSPLQMTNESVAGVGIQYERVIDKAGIFSFYLPVAFSFFDNESGSYNQPLKTSRVFTYIYPGAKIYPAGSAHRVAYSVGPSFGFGFGSKYKEIRALDPATGSVTVRYEDASVFKSGFLINNGINLQPTKSLYVGIELGIGIFYYSNEQTNFAAGDEPLVQFNFKMGYRF